MPNILETVNQGNDSLKSDFVTVWENEVGDIVAHGKVDGIGGYRAGVDVIEICLIAIEQHVQVFSIGVEAHVS